MFSGPKEYQEQEKRNDITAASSENKVRADAAKHPAWVKSSTGVIRPITSKNRITSRATSASLRGQGQQPPAANGDVYSNQMGGKTAYNFKKAGVIEGPAQPQAGIF